MTGSDEPTLLDSNILVYAYDKSEAKKHGAAKEAVKQLWLKQNGVLSVQNLVEFYSVVTTKISRPLPIDKAKQIVLDCIDGFEIVKYNENTVINAINNQSLYSIPFWDALLAATMEENSIDTIITENEKDFKKVKWMKVVSPFK